MNNHELEQEAALQGWANRIAQGRGPRETADGIIKLLFFTTDEENRWRRRELAKLFAGIVERAVEAEEDDREREILQGLAAKLRAVEAANS